MRALLIILITLSSSLCAQKLESIELEAGFYKDIIKLNCELKQKQTDDNKNSSDLYSCKANNRDYYLKHDTSSKSWNLLELSDSKVKALVISKVIKDNELVFRNFYSKDLIPQKNPTIPSQYEQLEAIEYNFEELYDDTIKDHDLKELKDKILTGIESEKNKIQSLYNNHEEVTLKTSTNQVVKCKRPKQDDLNNQCIHYSCDDIQMNGKKHKVQLRGIDLNSTDNTPYVTSYSPKGLGEDILIKEIKTKDKILFKSNKKHKELSNTPLQYSKSQLSFERLNNRIDAINRKMELNNCRDPKLKLFENALNQHVKKMDKELSSAKVVELIKYTNGYLESVSMLESNVTNNMCRIGADVYYYDKNDINQKEIDKLEGFIPKAKVVSKQKLNDIFDFALKQKDIPFSYYQEGCYARAHVLSNRIEDQMKIDTEKIWATGAVAPPNDPSISWQYHVASKVNTIDENGKIQGYVIDPSVASKPLLEKDWLKLISVNKSSKITTRSWPPTLQDSIVKNVQVTYTPNEVYMFHQDSSIIGTDQIQYNNEQANKELEKFRGLLDEK